MDKFLYPPNPHRVIITGPSGSGKTCFLSNLILNISNEFSKLYIYSPSIYQELYQKIIKCLNAFLPLNVVQNILNENISIDDLDTVIEEIINNEDFESSEIEIETYDSIEELKFPNEYDEGIIILDDLNQKEMEDPRVQAMFKRSRHNNLSIFILSVKIITNYQKELFDVMEIYFTYLNQIIFVMYKILYQDKASMDMTYRRI